MKQLLVGLLAAMAMFAFTISARQDEAPSAIASSPGANAVPLVSCPDVSGDGTVALFDDILEVAMHFGFAPGDTNYHVLYDVADPVNQPIDLFGDIFGTATRFGEICPAVDTQVVNATLWGIDNLPSTINPNATLVQTPSGLKYYRGSSDVPGQGVHYTRFENWDGNFDPQAPEGIVYQNGKLAAQLYVVDGAAVGWGTHAASSWPPPTTPHDVDLEGDADGPQCSPACSWAGGEGWHLHYFLCTVHIGGLGAAAIPAQLVYPGLDLRTQGNCAAYAGEPQCTVPITTTPCYRWSMNVGWMGHLWNHQLNENLIPDQGGNNGRFADCIPDTEGWKAFNCPA